MLPMNVLHIISAAIGETDASDEARLPSPTRVMPLDHGWLLARDPENVGRKQQWWDAPVPEAQETATYSNADDAFPGYRGVAWHWRDVDVPEHPHEQGRYLLRFWAVSYVSEVWVNGVHVGAHEGGEDPFVLDVTDAIRPGTTNRVAVRALSPGGQTIDGLVASEVPAPSGVGILDSVELHCAPAVRIADLFVRPDTTGTARVTATVCNALTDSAQVHLVATIAQKESSEKLDVARVRCELAPGETVIDTVLHVSDPRLWSPDDPNLYRVTATVYATGVDGIHEQATNIGFRDFRFEDGCFRLNGRRILIHGVCATMVTPWSSRRPFDPVMLRSDMHQLKVMGINMFRFLGGWNVPRRFQLEMADELGMLFYEECAASWLWEAASDEGQERFRRATAGMVKRDRNHPCVVIWGLLNECANDPLFHHAVNALETVRSVDDSRVVMLNSGRLDGYTREVNGPRGPGPATWRLDWKLVPNVSCNQTDETIIVYESDYGGGSIMDLEGSTWAPGQMALHSALDARSSAVCWTAPAAGEYTVSATFSAIAPRTSADVHLVVDGDPVYSQLVDVASQQGTATYSGTVSMDAGGTIHAVVGNGGKYPQRDMVNTLAVCDNTALDLKITASDGTAYDAAADFSATQNPNGPWAYGLLAEAGELDTSGFEPYTARPFELGVIIGSLSNPGSDEWEDLLSDRHRYKRIPHTAPYIEEFRTIRDEKCPVFMTEGGAGSAMDLMRLPRLCEQQGTEGFVDRRNLFLEDWDRWHMADTFGRPEDFFAQAVAAAADKRLVALNALRANPNIVGNLITGGTDDWTGLGIIQALREFKPGMLDAVADGHAPLRWCLFVEPRNAYRGTPVRLEAVLANEGVLSPGEYPARVRVFDPLARPVFDESLTITVPDPAEQMPFATPILCEDVPIHGPSGTYRLIANFEKGAAATGGEVEFFVGDPLDMPSVDCEVLLWGEDRELAEWLDENNIHTRPYEVAASERRQVILAARTPEAPGGREAFRELASRVGRGSTVVFLSPEVFGELGNPVAWLPLVEKGALADISSPVWPKDEWVKNHPIFDGMPCGGIMDQRYYLDLIPELAWVGTLLGEPRVEQDLPAEAVAGVINTGHTGRGYEAGLLVGVYELGAGRFILNTLLIREMLGHVPAAERLLRNMLRYAARDEFRPPVDLPADFDEQLSARRL